MKKNAITDALGFDKLSTLGMSVAYPNVNHDGVKPYLFVQFASANRSDNSLEGTQTRESGVLSVTVVVDEGGAMNAASDTADVVANLYPNGLRIPITGGCITITKPADIRPGFQGASDWRVPVQISYVADASI